MSRVFLGEQPAIKGGKDGNEGCLLGSAGDLVGIFARQGLFVRWVTGACSKQSENTENRTGKN